MRLKAIVIFSAVFMLLFTSFAFAKDTSDNPRTRGPVRLAKSADATGPTESILNINSIESWVATNGFFDAIVGGGWNGSYPRGTQVGAIFREGIVWGAKVTDDEVLKVRASGSSQSNGLQGGKAVGYVANPYSAPTGFEDPDDQQVWRVRTDWETADLRIDAASFNLTGAESVSQGEIDAIRAQYEHDWDHWPAAAGAPFNDVDGNGSYDPVVDVPGFPGASQTLWFVSNDLDGDVNAIMAGAPSIGLEMQMTLWGYDFPSTSPLGNISFKNVRLIYTGRINGPSDAHIDTMYVTQWADPDLGDFGDDFVGNDTTLSLGFVYNANKKDNVYFGDLGIPVPAVGYDFLQGPINADGDTLGMSSFTFFGAGGDISDPDRGVYSGTLQWFNLMEGFLPRPEFPVQEILLDPLTGDPTKFWVAGDPVTGTGWVDGIILPPGDRRMLVTTGPFEMALGDTQDIVVAYVGGIGLDNLSSVTVMKFVDNFAQFAFDNGFDLPSPPSPRAETVELDGRIVINWGSDPAAIASVEDAVSNGFVFEGYNVYQIPTSASSLADGKLLATFDLSNDVLVIEDDAIDPLSGLIRPQAKQFGTDSGLQRFFSTDRDALRGRPMSNGITYFFALTAYTFLPEEIQDTAPFKTLESSPVIFALTPQSPVPGTAYSADFAEEIVVTHDGTADAFLDITVVDPSNLTGDDYEVFFDKQLFFLDLDGVWKFAGADSSNPPGVGKLTDISASTVAGAAVVSANIGTFDLVFSLTFLPSADGEWADGFMVTLPAGIEILGSGITSGGWGDAGGGSDAGQNCATFPDGVIDTGLNTVTWGDMARTQFGCIENDVVFVVNVSPFSFPIAVPWEAYDDAFGSATVDAFGSASITELGFDFKTENHWNLLNVTTGVTQLEDQGVLGGVDIFTGEVFGLPAAPVVDGSFQINLAGSYSAPLDILSNSFTVDADPDDGRLRMWGTGTLFGNPDGFYTTFGSGTPVPTIDQAQPDLEFRFTGVAADNESPVTAGGQFSTQWPSTPVFGNPDVGTINAQLSVPFELWNLEANAGAGMQIEVAVMNRNADGEGADNTTAPGLWRMAGRDYIVVLLKEYTDDALLVRSPNDPTATWLLFFEQGGASVWSTGDEYISRFANPLQLGIDGFTFSTTAATVGDVAMVADDVENINVYPNPYYGLHELESSRFDKFVTLSHLPQTATIRIFNLGGQMVRVLDKADETQFMKWDLLNQNGFPVASGIYIIHIQMPDFGSKILKLALVQEEQILRNY